MTAAIGTIISAVPSRGSAKGGSSADGGAGASRFGDLLDAAGTGAPPARDGGPQAETATDDRPSGSGRSDADEVRPWRLTDRHRPVAGRLWERHGSSRDATDASALADPQAPALPQPVPTDQHRHPATMRAGDGNAPPASRPLAAATQDSGADAVAAADSGTIDSDRSRLSPGSDRRDRAEAHPPMPGQAAKWEGSFAHAEAAPASPEETASPGPALRSGHHAPDRADGMAAAAETGKMPIHRDAVDQTATPRAEIVAQQSIPAPPQPVSTGVALAHAMAAEQGWQRPAAMQFLEMQQGHTVAKATHLLKIELHPAELGTVTASMRLAGEQLSIEIRPENHEAFRRLSSDSDAIVKALRGLGFEVDRLTILQPSMAATGPARTDAGGQSGRDQSAFHAGSSGDQGEGTSNRQSGGNRNENAQEGAARPAPASRTASGGGLFI